MANVTYTVPNKSGSYDGDMVVKQYTSIAVDSGDIVTTDQPCRGLFLLSQGNVTIDGEIRMRGRGAFANASASGGSDSNAVNASGLRFPFLTSGGSSSLTAANTLLNGCGTEARSVIANFRTLVSNGTILSLIQQGANGGAGVTASSGAPGVSGSTGQTGGGGGGAANYSGTSGSGSYGSCFSGGSGGGPADNSGAATSAVAWSGQGGNGATNHSADGSGGAGNPAGVDHDTAGGDIEATAEGGGVGGLIIIVAGGNVTINASGKINCDGGRSGHTINSNDWLSSGGGGGGGNIIIAYKGSFTNNGSVTANGGFGGQHYQGAVGGAESTGSHTNEGGRGGAGSVQTLQII